MPGDLIPGLTAADPRLSDRVDEAFIGLRQTTAHAVGWDFLNTLDNAVIDINAPPPPSLDFNSWLKTGRAFDMAQAAEQFGWVKLTREDFGFHTYWRVWLLAAVQDGSRGRAAAPAAVEPGRALLWPAAALRRRRRIYVRAAAGLFCRFHDCWRTTTAGRACRRKPIGASSIRASCIGASSIATGWIGCRLCASCTRPRGGHAHAGAIADRHADHHQDAHAHHHADAHGHAHAHQHRDAAGPPSPGRPSPTHWPAITLTPSRTPRPTAPPSGTWYTATPDCGASHALVYCRERALRLA